MQNALLKIQRDFFILNLKLGLMRALRGIDYYRLIEYPFAVFLLDLNRRDKILDIGSLDSIFPIYLAARSTETYAVDINAKVGVLETLSKSLGISNLRSLVVDATKMPFPDNFFDKITAISTIEHVLPVNDGDLIVLKEIARVLRVGGIAVITVPYENNFSYEWRNHPIHGRNLRRGYDEVAIKTRLIKQTGLSSKIFYFCDDTGFWKIWYNFLVFLLAPISIVFGSVFLRLRTLPLGAKGAIIIFRKDKPA